jgi:phage shock protein PspC (stress-responsive transcriptional regulator)
MERKKKLCRDPRRGKILGVCAGLSEYFDVDVTLVRFIAIVLAFASFGTFIVLYFLLGIIMPAKDYYNKHEKGEAIDIDDDGNISDNVHDIKNELKSDKVANRTRNYVGCFLLLIGIWLLFGQFFSWWPIFRWDYVWPILLIVIGFLIIARGDSNHGRK